MLDDPFGEITIVADRNHPKTQIGQFLADNAVMRGLRRSIIMRPIHKRADSGNALAFIIEIRPVVHFRDDEGCSKASPAANSWFRNEPRLPNRCCRSCDEEGGGLKVRPGAIMSEHRSEPARDAKAAASTTETYFTNILVLNRALSEAGMAHRDSHAKPQTAEEPAAERAILWLGCNVLRTPHLAQLATKVARMLNPNMAVLGGPSHCCGSPMPEKSDRERALARTISHFQAEQVPALVSWCPSCHTNLRKGSDPADWGFDELHVTEFIARHLGRLRFKPRLGARVMLHGHTGTPDCDRDMECCRKLLEAIPGVSLVAEHSDVDLGLHCVPARLAPALGVAGFDNRIGSLLAQAREANAEMLVTIYHSCYREIETRSSANTPLIENYITLLAKALDLPVPANVYRELAHGGRVRLEQLLCEAGARGIDASELERTLKTEFPSMNR
jgi:Fe-S oxidoreductase